MAPRKKGGHWSGAGLEDARLEMGRFSQLNGYDEGLLIGGDWNEPVSTKGEWWPG